MQKKAYRLGYMGFFYPTNSRKSWYEFCTLEADVMVDQSGIGRGVRPHLVEIEEAIPKFWHHIIRGVALLTQHAGWWGCFFARVELLFARNRGMLSLVVQV